MSIKKKKDDIDITGFDDIAEKTVERKESKIKLPKFTKKEKTEIIEFDDVTNKPVYVEEESKAKSVKPKKKEKLEIIDFDDKSESKAEKKEKARKPIKHLGLIIGGAVAVVIAIAIAVICILFSQKVNYITISQTPDKMEYYVGENIDYSGLAITGVRVNGESFNIPLNECQIKGFDNLTVSDKNVITVTYKEFTATFSVVVKELPQSNPVLSKITIEKMPKTEYKVGEWLDTTGGIILCEYTDGSQFRVNLLNKHIYGWTEANNAGPGTYTLVVVYIENGTAQETNYTITITE